MHIRFRAGFSFFGMAMGLRAGFFKEEATESKIQNTLSRALYHFSTSVVIQSL